MYLSPYGYNGRHRKVYKPGCKLRMCSTTLASPSAHPTNLQAHHLINMYFIKSFVILAATAAMVSATPGVNRRVVCSLVAWTSRMMTHHNDFHRRAGSSNARTETTAKTTSEIASRTVSIPLPYGECCAQTRTGMPGCEGMFPSASDTIGTCSAGTFNGCPCDKCGSGNGYTGSCSANGCNGVQGTCTAGTYQGCPCD